MMEVHLCHFLLRMKEEFDFFPPIFIKLIQLTGKKSILQNFAINTYLISEEKTYFKANI